MENHGLRAELVLNSIFFIQLAARRAGCGEDTIRRAQALGTRVERIAPRKFDHASIKRIDGYSQTVRGTLSVNPDAFDLALAEIEAEIASAERAA